MSQFFQRVRFQRDHRWAPAHMSGYLDVELPGGRRRRMERHVAECPECRGLLDSLRRMLAALSGLPAPTGTVDAVQLAESVRRRLRDP